MSDRRAELVKGKKRKGRERWVACKKVEENRGPGRGGKIVKVIGKEREGWACIRQGENERK